LQQSKFYPVKQKENQMQFAQAVREQNNLTHTENGMAAFNSSMNANVDFFFVAAASRGKNITDKFQAALNENRELALRALLWLRDAREGAGERKQFRDLIRYLEMRDEAALLHIAPKIAEMGRWDDLLVFQTKEWNVFASEMIRQALNDRNALCAKWMPRKGPVAEELRANLGLTPKQYRKTLVTLSNTVEQKMCSNSWNEIEFGKLPSIAASRYQKAFNRRCAQAYAAYKQSLVQGTAKVNASAIFPYDVLRGSDKIVAQAQWNSLPNWLSEDARILPMIDVSCSMTIQVSQGLSAMQVAVSLGLYIATKQTGRFGGVYLTFNNKPNLAVVPQKNIVDLYSYVCNHDVGYSTNIEAAFNKVLETAVTHNVPQAEMPKYIIVFSDMQFNASTFGYRENAQQMVTRQFEQVGYTAPKLVWWNIADHGGNIPVKHDTQGNALVSGFSPSLVKSILSAKQFTPEGVMLETLLKDRYNLD
jgi:hypothetical protein